MALVAENSIVELETEGMAICWERTSRSNQNFRCVEMRLASGTEYMTGRSDFLSESRTDYCRMNSLSGFGEQSFLQEAYSPTKINNGNYLKHWEKGQSNILAFQVSEIICGGRVCGRW